MIRPIYSLNHHKIFRSNDLVIIMPYDAFHIHNSNKSMIMELFRAFMESFERQIVD